MTINARVRAVQQLRRSNAAGPHHAPAADDQPCVCDTAFTCLARRHEHACHHADTPAARHVCGWCADHPTTNRDQINARQRAARAAKRST